MAKAIRKTYFQNKKVNIEEGIFSSSIVLDTILKISNNKNISNNLDIFTVEKKIILFDKFKKENYFLDLKNDKRYLIKNKLQTRRTNLFEISNISENIIKELLDLRVHPNIISKLFFVSMNYIISVSSDLWYILYSEERIDRRSKWMRKMHHDKKIRKKEDEEMMKKIKVSSDWKLDLSDLFILRDETKL